MKWVAIGLLFVLIGLLCWIDLQNRKAFEYWGEKVNRLEEKQKILDLRLYEVESRKTLERKEVRPSHSNVP